MTAYQLTEADLANGWTAETAAAYHAAQERKASDLIRDSMEQRLRHRRRPQRCNNEYNPHAW